MAFTHIPVLFDEVMAYMPLIPQGVYLDGTLGGGGHSEGILSRCPEASLYGIDRDPNALSAASERLKDYPGFHPVRGNFHDAKTLLAAQGITQIDGALLDLGVSSPQLDEGERGFSYHVDAPLDMRMDPSQGVTAEELVNTLTGQKRRSEPRWTWWPAWMQRFRKQSGKKVKGIRRGVPFRRFALPSMMN